MILKELLALADAAKALQEAKIVPFKDWKFEVLADGDNGGRKGGQIDMEWFTDRHSAPYYLDGTERKTWLKPLKVGDEVTVRSDSGSIKIKRTK